MLYYYHTHREPSLVERAGRKESAKANDWSAYTGLIQEMIDEVPTCGYGRLQRKLSVDVNELIRCCILDPTGQKGMIQQIEMLENQYSIAVDLPGTGSFGPRGRPYGPLDNECWFSKDGVSFSEPLFERVYDKGGAFPLTMRELGERRRLSAGWATRWRGRKLKME